MGLIKSTNAPAALAPFSMADIEKQARLILLRARHKADELIQEAQRQADSIKRQAHTEGLAAGYEEGLTKGVEEGAKLGHATALKENQTQLLALVKAMTAALSEFNSQRIDLEAQALHEVTELAIAIAERVTRRMGRLDPQVAVANVGDALQLVVASADVRIAVHPVQEHVLREIVPRLGLQWPSLKHIEIVSDETLVPGGCRIYTRHGLIDADLDTQLERLAAELVPS